MVALGEWKRLRHDLSPDLVSIPNQTIGINPQMVVRLAAANRDGQRGVRGFIGVVREYKLQHRHRKNIWRGRRFVSLCSVQFG
ncbi:MAG TPA: hypothetical protein VH598_10140, partial [Verrucomicrobiae bacterium]|nr:hypothetical protein [Verrucomicrobiae bacterium]